MVSAHVLLEDLARVGKQGVDLALHGCVVGDDARLQPGSDADRAPPRLSSMCRSLISVSTWSARRLDCHVRSGQEQLATGDEIHQHLLEFRDRLFGRQAARSSLGIAAVSSAGQPAPRKPGQHFPPCLTTNTRTGCFAGRIAIVPRRSNAQSKRLAVRGLLEHVVAGRR